MTFLLSSFIATSIALHDCWSWAASAALCRIILFLAWPARSVCSLRRRHPTQRQCFSMLATDCRWIDCCDILLTAKTSYKWYKRPWSIFKQSEEARLGRNNPITLSIRIMLSYCKTIPSSFPKGGCCFLKKSLDKFLKKILQEFLRNLYINY